VSTSTGTLWRILGEGTPLAVVFYPELVTRQGLAEQVELVAPAGRRIVRANEVEAAFRDGDAIVLLLLDDEAGAVETLDRRRDELIDRTAPAVLFLLCDGSGEQKLRDAFALASWIRGREYDPTRAEPADVDAARCDFETATGRSPEAWLAMWRGGELPDTTENNLRAHEARLLETGS
jgi:hypothetical protein